MPTPLSPSTLASAPAHGGSDDQIKRPFRFGSGVFSARSRPEWS
jgi:hypothetical protein